MTYLTHVASGIADGGATTQDSPTLTVSGSNKVMYALIGMSDGTPAAPTGVVWDPTGVNEALTIVGTAITHGTYGNASLWRKIGPSAASAKAVRATWAASKGERMVAVWVETGIDQATPNGTAATTTANSTSASASMTCGAITTSAGSGQRVLMFGHSLNTGIFVSGAEFNSPTGTERFDTVTTGTAYDCVAGQEQTSSGSSVTPTWVSAEHFDGYALFAFALNDASANVSLALGGSAGTSAAGTVPPGLSIGL